MQDIALVLQVAQHPHPGMNAPVVPTLAIHRIQTEHLQLARIDLGRQNADHVPVFILEKPALGSGEHQQGRAGVSEDQKFHITVQFGTVPFMVFAVHAGAEYLT